MAVAIQFYTRTACPLCEDAWRLLREFDGRVDVKEIDIFSDPTLHDAHAERVPVLSFADGRELFGRIDRESLQTAIESLEAAANDA
jgi:glutaredoxin